MKLMIGLKKKKKDKNYVEPRLVDFFVKNNLKVEQVALGQYHTVVRTHDGDVWTWGYGGK